jgi:AcrR family transcriptional regulator
MSKLSHRIDILLELVDRIDMIPGYVEKRPDFRLVRECTGAGKRPARDQLSEPACFELIKRLICPAMSPNVSRPEALRRASAPKRRGPGRPRAAAPGQRERRERLLDAAVALYGEVGIAGANLRDIAARAEVTPAMVHYYFGSKDELRDAVVEERLMPLIGALRAGLEAAGPDPRDLITTFVGGMYAAVGRFPWLPSLWVREVLCENGALRDLLVTRIAPQLPLLLAARLTEAQRQGALPADLDPRLLIVSLMGLTLLPFAAAPIWRRVFAAGDVDADKLLSHTLALLDHGIGGRRAK